MVAELTVSKCFGRYRATRTFREPEQAAAAFAEAVDNLVPGGEVVFKVRPGKEPEREVSGGINR